MRTPLWLLPLILAATVLVYLPGLAGPFVFDDVAHIERNRQVHIADLSPASLQQAWRSSYAVGLASRPLAQLTFGINHALSGLDTWYFKATNLGMHLVTGLLVFALARQLGRALALRTPVPRTPDTAWPALLAAALWLLHPINLTPVLYVVQRMTGLSALFVFAGLWCHVTGRLRMARGAPAGFWLALAGLPVAATGGLAKESAALYPLLVLALEWTVLRHLAAPRRALLVAMVGVVPLLLGAAYLAANPGLISYHSRDFTLAERLLTEARVLWLYLRMLLVPDPAVLGFFHDDIATSTSLFTPRSTLAAVLGWAIAIPVALLLARRWPVASFALLFFLAGHVLESSFIPLELVFEHRNYLPAFGPLFALAWLLAVAPRPRLRQWLALAAVLWLVALAAVTHLRALDWNTRETLVLREVSHHPASPRANFLAGQLLMDQLGQTSEPAKVYAVARGHLLKVLELQPDNLNARFALIFLELMVDRDPPPALIDQLVSQLRTGVVDPVRLSIGQFGFLVRWQHASPRKLSDEAALAILHAPLENPGMDAQGRAAILSALRAYHDRVLHDLPDALAFAQQAARTWPTRWHYHYRLVQLLIRLGDWRQAQTAFDRARTLPSAALNADQRDELAQALRTRSTENLRIHD